MEMLIDKHIEILKSYYNGFTGQAGNLQESIDVAVCIMRKYQQIEEIVNTWRNDITAGDYHCMAEVAEVVEDGND